MAKQKKVKRGDDWRATIAHVCNELEELDEETALNQAKTLRALLASNQGPGSGAGGASTRMVSLDAAIAAVDGVKFTGNRFPVTQLEQMRMDCVNAVRGLGSSPETGKASGGTLTDAEVDRVLSTVIPGGSVARDWFLPHSTKKGSKNIRDVVRRMADSAYGLRRG